MSEMNKINEMALENVVGGKTFIVKNESVDYINCRQEPGLDTKVFFTIPNGTEVIATGRSIVKDGYEWQEIMLAGAYDCGWVAKSLLVEK